MEFKVMSRKDAIDFSYKKPDKECVIISIADATGFPAKIAENEYIKAVLFIFFDDVDGKSVYAMTAEEARIIADFALKAQERVPLLIVQCEAGISRSAGVCAALMKYFDGDDIPIFGNPYYKPNMHCYRMVLNALNDRDEASQKG
ncbi:MAG: hypothetical protein HUJ80_09570 [Firmicutes bacterium]|nr:hypothetical protein [Bacillota bacterium]